MSGLTGARRALADAVTSAGIECSPYPPDSLAAPAAYVDAVAVDYSAGAGYSFCATGSATARVVAVAPRHDTAGSIQHLEDLAPGILRALEAVPGVRVTGVESGTVEVNGNGLPAVLFTVQFHIAE